MVKEEGLATLWRGSTPTIVRAMAMNVGMLTSYEEIKERIIRITKDEKSVATKVLSSACAGVICATMSLPPDNVKTKLMKMRAGPDGKMPYTGLIDCFAKSIKREGFFKLWVGLETFIIRVCPHAVIALLVNDYLNSTYGRSKVY